ncbi:MAG TPA: response regulator transcription factor [Candidatus Limnocylindrales bacterium]|jgi:DNA-binding NarL/FixJ family response regulator|nr:response regulator transcription factor [Candidatus Limnocylindrales bacterium]
MSRSGEGAPADAAGPAGPAPEQGEAGPAPEAQRIRIAVVDDHPVVRDGTAALLADRPDLVVAATGSSIDDARDLLARSDLDVILLDVRLGTRSGLNALGAGSGSGAGSALEGSSASAPSGRTPAVIVLTAYDYPQYARAAMDLGAAGFVTKTAPIEELVAAIRRAAAGELAYQVRPSRSMAFSGRELEVLRLVVDGRSNDEIGATLGISPKTVEAHLRRLFDRCAVASRTELATRALREGWLDLPPAA